MPSIWKVPMCTMDKDLTTTPMLSLLLQADCQTVPRAPLDVSDLSVRMMSDLDDHSHHGHVITLLNLALCSCFPAQGSVAAFL